MAEMEVADKGGKKKGPGVKKGKKLSTRVDLTPMVDLGFLLITFFMFTTTLSKPKTMEINMPYKDENIQEEDETKIKESTALTILLSKKHRVYYYEGMGTDPETAPEVKVTTFKPQDGIRDVIIDKRKKVDDLKRTGALGEKDKTTILIKPDSNSTYEDMVNILDEMAINDIRVYAIVDITDVDREFIHETEQANGQ
ncbi:MAG: biopolymer transporter ExbD [Chitinophagales bacterium]|nr:biopolymer transporter ExbD [Chitinophagales bacterium]